MDTRTKILIALTEYDRKQSTKKGYNRFALGMYCQALQNTMAEIESGSTIRAALKHNFCGRLLDVCLKAAGEPLATKDELRGW